MLEEGGVIETRTLLTLPEGSNLVRLHGGTFHLCDRGDSNSQAEARVPKTRVYTNSTTITLVRLEGIKPSLLG